jgi:hypothetical protein
MLLYGDVVYFNLLQGSETGVFKYVRNFLPDVMIF